MILRAWSHRYRETGPWKVAVECVWMIAGLSSLTWPQSDRLDSVAGPSPHTDLGNANMSHTPALYYNQAINRFLHHHPVSLLWRKSLVECSVDIITVTREQHERMDGLMMECKSLICLFPCPPRLFSKPLEREQYS